MLPTSQPATNSDICRRSVALERYAVTPSGGSKGRSVTGPTLTGRPHAICLARRAVTPYTLSVSRIVASSEA